jgi:hypothetical protein
MSYRQVWILFKLWRGKWPRTQLNALQLSYMHTYKCCFVKNYFLLPAVYILLLPFILVCYFHHDFCFPLALQPNSGIGRLHETFRFTSVTISRTDGRTPWTGDQLVARALIIRTSELSGFFLWLVKDWSCHHGMARPQVADGGDSLQFWRVAANILNKQSRKADKGWSSSLGVGRWANNSSP